MAKLRNFQFLRNNDINSFASYALARTAAETAFAGINLEDGEIALYSYKLDSDATTVHTLLGIKRNGGIEILGNYDELTTEYQSYVTNAINALDTPEGGVTGSNNGVSVTVKQVDGKIDSVSVVAPSLTSAIEALDVEAFSLTEVTGNELKGYQISEKDGKIVKEQTAETLLTFASAPTAVNKVVTQAEITALNADKTSTNGKNVQVQVVEQGGVITGVNVTTDNTVNANDVATAITTAIEGLDSEAENTTGDIKVKVTQVDGELTAVAVTDTLAAVAHTGAAADVAIVDEGNLYTTDNVEAALAEVMTKANALVAAQLSAGKGIEIGTDNKINANFDIAIETRTGENAGEYIVIKDGENVIAEVNANAFVKDGFLQKVEKDAGNNTLKFTWNTDAGIEETIISISDLCDVYTADETYLHLDGYKFEHKTSGVTAGQYAANAADVTVNSTTSQSFKVPTLTVDAAGHVTAASEKTVTISLPASIDTAIQTINGHAQNASFITTTVTPSDDNTTQDIAVTAKIGNYAAEGQVDGLATTSATKTYVDSKINALDESTTILLGGNGISVVDSGSGNDHIYEVKLNGVTRIDNPTAEGVAGNPTTSSFADDTTTFTYVKEVKTDAYGRVTGILTETVTEFFDAGTY
jgi:hypothetical protein